MYTYIYKASKNIGFIDPFGIRNVCCYCIVRLTPGVTELMIEESLCCNIDDLSN